MTTSGPDSASGSGPMTPGKQDHPVVTAGALLSDTALTVRLALAAGKSGLHRTVAHARIQKSGLALVGHFHGVVPTRVQILGETEIAFLREMDPETRRQALRGFFGLGLSLVIVSSATRSPLRELTEEADRADVPLALSAGRSSHTIAALHLLLDDRLAPRCSVHGVMIDVFGQGILLLGKSGIGKSELALELVMRGHRLVADDVVRCDWRPPGMVFGAPPELLRHHIEVRGLGVLNLKNLLGVACIRERKRIDLVIRLLEWSEEIEYDRMGLDENVHEILGVKLRELRLPVRPGRSMASIVEVAARNELVRATGVNGAQDFFDRLHQRLMPTPGSGGVDEVTESSYPPPQSSDGGDA
jgi:HPr kinase/phosphorylase